MLYVNQVSKSFGIQPLLVNISFSVKRDEKLGIVGLNGCGKTTLLRILSGLEKADGGKVQIQPADLRIGYLAQNQDRFEDKTTAQILDSIQGEEKQLSLC